MQAGVCLGVDRLRLLAQHTASHRRAWQEVKQASHMLHASNRHRGLAGSRGRHSGVTMCVRCCCRIAHACLSFLKQTMYHSMSLGLGGKAQEGIASFVPVFRGCVWSCSMQCRCCAPQLSEPCSPVCKLELVPGMPSFISWGSTLHHTCGRGKR